MHQNEKIDFGKYNAQGYCLHRALCWLGLEHCFDLEGLLPNSLISQVQSTSDLILQPYLVDYHHKHGLRAQGAKSTLSDWRYHLGYILQPDLEGLLSVASPDGTEGHALGFSRKHKSLSYEVLIGPDANKYLSWHLTGIFLILKPNER